MTGLLRQRTRVLSLLALWLAVGSGAAAPAAAEDDGDHIRPEALLAAIESGHPPVIVDVRTQAEFDSGHVPGAIHIPFYAVLTRRAELPAPSTPVVVYCAHGPRAGMAKLQLRAAGFEHVRYLDGHMSEWSRRGLPVERTE